MKRLYRSETDRMWAGVLGGFAEYFEVDPTFIRGIYIILDIVTGIIPLLIGYFILAYIMPLKSEVKKNG